MTTQLSLLHNDWKSRLHRTSSAEQSNETEGQGVKVFTTPAERSYLRRTDTGALSRIGVCGSVGLLQLVMVAIRKWSIDPISNPQPHRETL
jgi:hypothetical protein